MSQPGMKLDSSLDKGWWERGGLRSVTEAEKTWSKSEGEFREERVEFMLALFVNKLLK